MSAHTPGPWSMHHLHNSSALGKPQWRIGPAGQRLATQHIAEVYSHLPHDWAAKSPDACLDECAANARLIAAAPKLLAALRGVLRVADRATVEFDAARAAIAKATGEST